LHVLYVEATANPQEQRFQPERRTRSLWKT
jgi:hypothetical protein